MGNSTPTNASTRSGTCPPSIHSWLILTPETRSSSHLEGADASTQTEGLRPDYRRSHASSVTSTFVNHRLYPSDNEDNGTSPFEDRHGHSGSPSSASSKPCGSNDDETSPAEPPRKHSKLVDATIRPVTPSNAPVSLDTLCFPYKPALPRLRTSTSNVSSLTRHKEPYPSTEPPSPPPCVSPLAGDSNRRRFDEHELNALREYADQLATVLEMESAQRGAIEDTCAKSLGNQSFRTGLRRFFQSKAGKSFGLVKRLRNLWK